jgi:hypothetical protein
MLAAEPEAAAGEELAVAMDELARQLRLADPAQAGRRHGLLNRRRRAAREQFS